MSKCTKIFIVVIVLALLGYVTYGYLNSGSESGENIEVVEEAFADEIHDTYQTEWMADEMETPSNCAADKIINKLQEQGFSNIYERMRFISKKNAEYVDKYDADIAEYEDFISDEDKDKMKEYAEGIAKAQTATYIQMNEPKYIEIVNAAKADKEAYLAKIAAEKAARAAAQRSSSHSGGNWSGSYGDFMRAGVVNSGGNKYTYYSESVLPGGGLNIPGRHTENGFVKDGDGYIVVANDKPNGTVVDTPFGTGKVYDKGTSGNHYDIYVQ